MEPVEVTVADPADQVARNEFIARRGRVPPLTLLEWANVLSQAYGVETRFFCARQPNGGIVGILPTYLVGGLGRGIQLFSLRHGLVAESPEVATKLIDAVRVYALTRGASQATITSGTIPMDLPCRLWMKTTVEFELTSNIEAMWLGLRDKTRNVIRKAERQGLVVKRDASYLDAFYRLYATRMASKGVPLHSWRFFEALAASFRDRFMLYTALQGGEPVAGAIFLRGETVASYFLSAFRPGSGDSGSTNFLMWEAIKDCVAQRITLLDLGESTPGGGVYNFKIWLGGRPSLVYYYDLLRHMHPETTNLVCGDRSGDSDEQAARPWTVAQMAEWLPNSVAVPLLIFAKQRGRLV